MDDLIEFWALVVDVWKNDVAGTDIGRILAATAIFIGFLLVRKLLV